MSISAIRRISLSIRYLFIRLRMSNEQHHSPSYLHHIHFNSKSLNKGKLKRNIQVKLDSVLMNGRWEKYALCSMDNYTGEPSFFLLCRFGRNVHICSSNDLQIRLIKCLHSRLENVICVTDVNRCRFKMLNQELVWM